MNNYKLQAPYEPNGDQPEAIKKLVKGVNTGKEFQTLLGATGTGKTFTIANVIQQTGRPALVLAHNKTLAAQLCNELREFFPKNAVEYFISYYDYYQPEAYVPVSDTYIAKTASINEEIDMLRHSATRSLFERKDVIVVASISCIYGLGIPSEYLKAAVKFEVGKSINLRSSLRSLVENQYTRNDIEITIERDDSNNEYLLKGFAWDYSQGYKEITKKFLINPEVIGTFNDDDLKIFFFDEKEIYVESNDSVFTGIYKKY